jgi:predicted protein tyrosine phosphatase
MEIFVSSRNAIFQLILRFKKEKPESKIVVVSITDPKSELVILPLEELNILRLSFHDLDEKYSHSSTAIILFNKYMAQQIKSFVKQNLCDNLIILNHCEAGISRSAGVAGALAKHFLGDDDIFFRSPYLPNRLTYSILLNLLSGKENQIPNVIICNEDSNVF